MFTHVLCIVFSNLGVENQMISHILVIDDDQSHLISLKKIFEKMGLQVYACASGMDALALIESQTVAIQIVLTDLMLTDTDGLSLLKQIKQHNAEIEIVIMTAYGTIERAVEAMKEGAYHFITKPFRRAEIEQVIHRIIERGNLILENKSLKKELESVKSLQKQSNHKGMIGHSMPFHQAFEMSMQAATSTATVLLMGESGTGKEIFARAIHQASPRANKAFIAVNCGALPEGIIEAELFGVAKGAFTGAVQDRDGRFAKANGGTLFLDEIAELPIHLQVKLLRVLQFGEFEKVGGDQTLKVDCRVIAATNLDLNLAVKEGDFREDLFYRLNVIPIILPALRQRKEDIPLLADHFLKLFCEKYQKQILGFQANALDALSAYDWPGNVRALENTIERAVVLSKSNEITLQDLPVEIADLSQKPQMKSPLVDANMNDSLTFFKVPFGTPLEEVEKRYILQTLAMVDQDKRRAALLLGIASRTIYRKLNQNHKLEED
jgi:two-component system response regulator HydG